MLLENKNPIIYGAGGAVGGAVAAPSPATARQCFSPAARSSPAAHLSTFEKTATVTVALRAAGATANRYYFCTTSSAFWLSATATRPRPADE